MKKFLKIASVTVLILIVLFIFLTVGLNVFLKPEFMRKKVSAYVSEKIHRQIAINGDLTWAVFPRIKVTLNHLDLGNPDGFMPNDKHFVEIQRMDLGLGLFPLLRGELEVNYLALRGVNVHLIKNTQGQTNWDMSQSLNAMNPSSSSKTEAKVNKMASNVEVKVGSIFVSNVNVSYQDLLKKETYAVQDLTITASHIRANKPFDLSVSTNFDAGSKINGNLSFASEVLFNPSMTQLQFGNMQLESALNVPGMNPLALIIKGSAMVDLDKKHLMLTEFDGNFDAAHLSGEIQTDFSNPAMPSILGKMQLSPVNPKKLYALAKQVFPNFSNTNALRKVSGSFELSASPKSFMLNKLQLNVDGSSLSGSIGVTDLTKKIFQFSLSLDQLNLDLYKMAEANASPAATTSKNEKAPSAAAGASPLRQWGGTGSMSIGRISSGNIVLNNTNFLLSASQGIFNVNPIKTNVFQGNYIGQATYNAWLSSFNVKGAMTGIDAGEFMKNMTSITKVQISGKADINQSLSSRGTSGQAIMQNLNGNVLFVFKNGVLHGIDIPYYFSLGKAMVNGQKLSSVTNTNQTQFGNMTGSFTINQGVASNTDFLLQGPVLQAKGSGTADLINQQIHYQLLVSSNALGNQTIPLKISGPFKNPSISPDIQTILKEQVTDQLKKQVNGKVSEVLQKNVGKDTSDAIVKGINSLLGQ